MNKITKDFKWKLELSCLLQDLDEVSFHKVFEMVEDKISQTKQEMELINGDKIENTWIAGLKEGRKQGKKVTHSTNPDYCCACDYDIAVMEEKIKQAKQEERKRIGKELWKWFHGYGYEDIEDVTERITGVKDPRRK